MSAGLLLKTPVRLLVLLAVAATTVYGVSSVLRLGLPAPTGSFEVGRQRLAWIDASRPETHTADPADRREVIAQVWYPAAPSTGAPAEYVDDLERLEDAFVASGEVSRPAALGLRLVQTRSRTGATVSSAAARFPVLLLSPGNATNAAFYATLAEDLASHGYVVVGIEHPFQVTAVALTDGRIATYQESPTSPPLQEGSTRSRVAERVADVRFTLDQLARLASSRELLEGRIDMGKVGILGHSLGGITAAEACRTDARLKACLNIDGEQAGGPFSLSTDGKAPEQPFLYLTKERQIHPVINARFEEAGAEAYRVVVPAASHDQFADTALFKPTANPFDQDAANVIAVSRGFARAFFAHVLRGEPRDALGRVNAPIDVYVNVYPLGDRPPLPRP
jgi:dienelactone hydrolase